jgi:electron transfer flavoprotein beta subunit
MALDVAVLLSIGRHPASGRSRRADLDARALELALRLGLEVRLHAVHAGDPTEPALGDYLGMGLATLTVLRQPPGADILPALADYLAALKPGLVLAGLTAEAGEGSGMLPYLLAQRLGAALLPAMAEASLAGPSLAGQGIAGLQALPRGRRRRLAAGLPAVLTVDRAAAPGRQSAFARARAGRIVTIEAPPAPRAAGVREVPARPKPRRLKIATGGSAAERLRAATEMQAGRGQLLVQPTPEAAAEAILDYLVKEGILSAPTLAAPETRD